MAKFTKDQLSQLTDLLFIEFDDPNLKISVKFPSASFASLSLWEFNTTNYAPLYVEALNAVDSLDVFQQSIKYFLSTVMQIAEKHHE